MDRKQFLTLSALTGISIPFQSFSSSGESRNFTSERVPQFLVPGDLIGITSPASYISLESVSPSVELMHSWGFRTRIGQTIGSRDYTLGGSDEERLADLQRMLDDPEIKAIMCARGGYGVVRIIDQLDFSKFRSKPKWLIGFSDITALHAHINTNFNIATLHSKMCNSFPNDWSKASPIQIETILSIRQVLSGWPVEYTAQACPYNRFGLTEGVLVGGNLSLLETLAGSPSDLHTDGKILFVEDTHEQLYRIDRMFWNLKRSGKLSRLKGLILGGFRLKEDSAGDEFGRTIYEIVSEKIKHFDYPVCFEFPVGHQVDNYALKCGARHLFAVNESGGKLRSI